MRTAIILLFLAIIFSACSEANRKNVTRHFDEPVVSGEYDDGLKIAYNPQTAQVTGYFEMDRGEGTDGPQFSCGFYIEGKLSGDSTIDIKTYFPPNASIPDTSGDLIKGTLRVKKHNELFVLLPEDHGGCQMAGQSFKDSTASFSLAEKKHWIAIQFVKNDKAFFYSDTQESSQRKAYLVKGDVIYVTRMKDNWLYAAYAGKNGKEIKGWLKADDLNKVE